MLLLELERATTPEERGEALWRLGLIFAAAIAGDGHVNRDYVRLTSGEGGATLLWLAALQKAGELAGLGKLAGFKPKLYVRDRYYYLDVTSGDATALAAVMPAVGLNPKAEKAIAMFRKGAESQRVDIELVEVRRTEGGATAVVKVKAGPWEARYNVYLREDEMMLNFNSTDVDRVYQMAHVLRLLGVRAEPKKESGRDVWYIDVYTDALASKTVLPAFREALAKAVEEAARNSWVKAETAEKWVKKLRASVTVAEDKPKFSIQTKGSSSLDILYTTTNAEKLAQYVERLRGLGLMEGVHLTTKEPKDGERGYLRITAEGVVKLAELAHHAEDEEIRLKAAEWIKHLIARAEESGEEAAKKKLEELIQKGAARGALTLTGLKQEVEVKGEKHVVEVKQAKAWIGEEDGKLHIRVEAVVDGVEVDREYTFFFRGSDGAVRGLISTWADTPGGREADIKRIQALSTAIFGKPGTLICGGKQLDYSGRHLEHAMQYKEIKEVAERWLARARNAKLSNIL